MSISTQRLGIELLRLREEIDSCYSRLQVFPHQGLGLNMLSNLGQMVRNIDQLISVLDPHEFDSQYDPHQLSFDFDGPPPGGDGAYAGQAQSKLVP